MTYFILVRVCNAQLEITNLSLQFQHFPFRGPGVQLASQADRLTSLRVYAIFQLSKAFGLQNFESILRVMQCALPTHYNATVTTAVGKSP